MSFYSDMAAVAQEMIQEFGRTVTFVKWSRTPVDPARPEAGIDLTASTTLSVSAVQASPDDVQDFGFELEAAESLVRKGGKIVLVSGSDVSGDGLETYDSMEESDNSVWRVARVHKLRPGDTTLLYAVGLEIAQ